MSGDKPACGFLFPASTKVILEGEFQDGHMVRRVGQRMESSASMMKTALQKYWNKENINNADMLNTDICTYVAEMFYSVAQVLFVQWSEVAEGTSDSRMYFWPVKHSGIRNNRLSAPLEGSTIRQLPKAGVFMMLGISFHKPYWEQCFSLDEFNVFYQPFGKLFINSCFPHTSLKCRKLDFTQVHTTAISDVQMR